MTNYSIDRLIADSQAIKIVQAQENLRSDATQGPFIQELLRETIGQVFRYEYAATPWAAGQVIDIRTGDEGATSWRHVERGYVGQAKIVADNATDLPAADVEGKEILHSVHTIGMFFEYSTQEMRSAARMSRQGLGDIIADKAASLRSDVDRLVDNLMRTGDPNYSNLYGVCNAPGINVVAAPTGNWLTATSDEIIADFAAGYNAAIVDTDYVEEVNTVCIPAAQYQRMIELQKSVASDKNVLQWLQANYPQITNWVRDYGMKDAGAGGNAALLFLRRDPQAVFGMVNMPLRPLPVERRGLSLKVPFEMRYGGIGLPRPKSVTRLDGV